MNKQLNKKLLAAMVTIAFVPIGANAVTTLTMETSAADGAGGLVAMHMAEVAKQRGIANIQVATGKTLTKSVQQVAQGQTDIAGTPFIVYAMLSRGLGPYGGLGKAKGAELAANLRLLYPYHFSAYYLFAFESSGIKSWDDLKGRNVFNGPPSGGALTGARTLIQLATGLQDGKGYNGKQVAWGQANSLFMDGSVDASVRTATNPASFMPLYTSAGRVNLISVPKDKFESPMFQKWASGPGQVPVVTPISSFTYGKEVNVISEDNQFRAVAATGGDTVNKAMPFETAKALTKAFLDTNKALLAKTAWAPANLYGQIADDKMGICVTGLKLHPGAVAAWEEAGFKVPDCAKP